jgi:hypothetical protein
MDSPEGIRVKD